jgi:hypothetical protein
MTELTTVHEVQWGDRVQAPELSDAWRGRSRRARLLEKMPRGVANSFTEAQLAAIERALEERPTGKARVDLRLSIPLFQRRRFLVLLAGSEGRSPERRRLDRSKYPVWTFANLSTLMFSSLFLIPAFIGFAHMLAVAFAAN